MARQPLGRWLLEQASCLQDFSVEVRVTEHWTPSHTWKRPTDQMPDKRNWTSEVLVGQVSVLATSGPLPGTI
jgi:hypothetical protein